MFDWDDLRYFLALARSGSSMAAAKALGVNQSTVKRRLAEFERRLGRPLIERHASGYRLTPFGEEMRPQAERVEQAVRAFSEKKAEIERGEIGSIRITCPEPIIARMTQAGLLDRFHARYPHLKIEFVMSDRYLDLTKGDADVALRSGDTDDEVLVGRKIAESIWAIYGSRHYLDAHGRPKSLADLAAHRLIGLDQSMAKHRVATWLQEIAPNTPLAARSSSVLGLVAAAKSGVGLAPLPIALGDAESDLVRVLGPVPALTRNWRLLTHPDLRHTPRVAAFFDFITDEIAALRPILTG